MQMMYKEMRKFFVRQRALIWIAVFFGIKIISMWYVSGIDDTDTMKSYDSYLEKCGGRLDEEKTEYILGQYNRLNQVSKNVNDLEEQYEQGQITRDAYLEQLNQISQLKQEQETIKLFYSKYQYAVENSEQRYIVDENGWTKLLTEERMDYLLVLLLFLITVPLFCVEYETEMHYLQLCSKNGRLCLAVIKIIMISVLAALLSLLFSLVEFIYYKNVYGLSFGYAPIQSLPFFQESPYSFTFMQLWGTITATRMVGAVFLCIIIMAVSVMARKSLLSIIGSALLVVIPGILSNTGRLKYMLPFPTGFLYGSGYFFPDIYDYRLVEEGENLDVEKYVSFSAFTRQHLYVIAIAALVIMCFLIGFVICRYLGMRHVKGRKRVMAVLLAACAMTMCTSGCSPVDDNRKEEFYQNSYVTSAVITDQYYFYAEESNIIGQDLETGEEFFILRDVFEQQDSTSQFAVSFFATNQYLYYAKDYINELQIYRVDLTDFSEQCLYTKSYRVEKTDCSYDLVFVTSGSFFVHDSISGYYYYIDRENGKWTSLGNVGYLTLGDYGNKVYYENNDSQLVEYCMDTKEENVYSDINLRSQYSVKSSRYYIYDGYCYYTNMLDQDYIYRYCFETGINELFLKKNDIKEFWINDQYFYYVSTENSLYRTDTSSFQTDKVLDKIEGIVEMEVDGITLYVEQKEGIMP